MQLGSAMGGRRIEIESLSRDERLDLLQQIWESLGPEDVPVTDEQRAELDQRSDALDREMASGREVGVPWDEVVRQLRARR